MITLVLGGNKSGKSDFALDLLAKGTAPGVFIATGKAKDMDFRTQIRQHRQNRNPNLEVIEVSEGLPQTLQKAKLNFPTLLVDSLDYWLFACREAGCEAGKIEEFLAILDEWDSTDLILVSCETGLGPLPGGSAVRAFVRSLGALNQSVAARADQAYLIAAGLPLTLKQGQVVALFRQLDGHVYQLLDLFNKDDNWLIVINADPDALGSALALRRIMARRVSTVAIAQINEIKRPDNLSMIRYCRIPTQKLIPNLTAQFDKFALVDSQPHHNPEFKPFQFSVVIDHHPIAPDNPVQADYVDIRPKYGAVCTMMTEYLYNMKIRPAKLLATALMYGIRCDTRTFEREFIDADMAAFKYLSKYADSKLMNRISRSEFHLDWMRYFSRAFYNLRRIGQGLFAHCGNVENPDILVIVADFFTRVHNVPWVVVSGTSDDKLVCIFRGDGLRRDMGSLAQKTMNGLGSAGGHKQAARAEVEVEALNGVDPEIFMLKRLGQGRKKTISRI